MQFDGFFKGCKTKNEVFDGTLLRKWAAALDSVVAVAISKE